MQGFIVPLLWMDLEDVPPSDRVPVTVIVVLGVGTLLVMRQLLAQATQLRTELDEVI